MRQLLAARPVFATGTTFSLCARAYFLGVSTNNCRVVCVDINDTADPADFFGIRAAGVSTTGGRTPSTATAPTKAGR